MPVLAAVVVSLWTAGANPKSRYVDPSKIKVPKQTCLIELTVNDPDPAGLNVRAGPSVKHALANVLPPRKCPVVLTVYHSENGWFYFEGAGKSYTNNAPDPQYCREHHSRVTKTEWAPVGWVNGVLLRLEPRETLRLPLRPGPRKQGKKDVRHLSSGTPLKISDCSGPWTRVSGKDEHGKPLDSPPAEVEAHLAVLNLNTEPRRPAERLCYHTSG